MRKKVTFAACAALLAASFTHVNAETSKPMIVLVHGAFADASSWNGVASRLERDGYSVVAVANPLRGLKSDADYLARFLKGLNDPVVLVGHSYGGSVMSETTADTGNVKALVFVAAFAPAPGESAVDLSGKNPGSTLSSTLSNPVVLADGSSDLYIDKDKFPQQFAADVPIATAQLMAASQRPVADTALMEHSFNARWQMTPSWFVYGDQDKNIPPVTLQWMAERAHSRGTYAIKGGSHSVMISHPEEVSKVIEEAAEATR